MKDRSIFYTVYLTYDVWYPNISGLLQHWKEGTGFFSSGIYQGCFAFVPKGLYNVYDSMNNIEPGGGQLSFEASRSSAIYNKTNTVQPSSLSSLILIKF